jgi:hypothetical protein
MRSIVELELELAIDKAEKDGFQCFIIAPEDMESMTRKGKADLMGFLIQQFENYKRENQKCDSPYC